MERSVGEGGGRERKCGERVTQDVEMEGNRGLVWDGGEGGRCEGECRSE